MPAQMQFLYLILYGNLSVIQYLTEQSNMKWCVSIHHWIDGRLSPPLSFHSRERRREGRPERERISPFFSLSLCVLHLSNISPPLVSYSSSHTSSSVEGCLSPADSNALLNSIEVLLLMWWISVQCVASTLYLLLHSKRLLNWIVLANNCIRCPFYKCESHRNICEQKREIRRKIPHIRSHGKKCLINSMLVALDFFIGFNFNSLVQLSACEECCFLRWWILNSFQIHMLPIQKSIT